MYKAVNQKFADIVVAEARNEKPIVLVQDYHFALLPRMMRQNAAGSDDHHLLAHSLAELGSRSASARGGGDSRGPARQLDRRLSYPVPLQQFHRKRRPLPGKPHRTRAFLHLLRRPDHAGHPYPISIAWPPSALETQPPVAECRAKVFDQYGLSPDTKLLVGVERIDYTKGIVDRLWRWSNCSSANPNGSAR